MSEKLLQPKVTRRRLLFAAVAVPVSSVSGLAGIEVGSELFQMDGPDLIQLSEKVLAELPTAVGSACLSALSERLKHCADVPHDRLSEYFRLLHSDDLVNDRVHWIHGLAFSQTQIGVLQAILLKRQSTS